MFGVSKRPGRAREACNVISRAVLARRGERRRATGRMRPEVVVRTRLEAARGTGDKNALRWGGGREQGHRRERSALSRRIPVRGPCDIPFRAITVPCPAR